MEQDKGDDIVSVDGDHLAFHQSLAGLVHRPGNRAEQRRKMKEDAKDLATNTLQGSRRERRDQAWALVKEEQFDR